MDIPVSQIQNFPNHPYKVKDDENMAELVESVKTRGLIQPVLVRPIENGMYEMVSGHRRKRAQGNDYTDAVDSDEFRTSLMEFCTLENRSGKLYSMDSDGNETYHISMPVLSFKESNQLELCVNFTVTVPIRLLNDTAITANIPLEVTSILTEKF